jgi:hypothetical protein
MIGRREFITLFGGVAMVLPLSAQAEQAASPPRIGVLLVGLSPESREAKQSQRRRAGAGIDDAGPAAFLRPECSA